MVTASIYLPNGKMDFVCNQMYHNQQSSDDRQVCQRMRQMTSTRVSGNITYMLDFPRQPDSVRVAASDIMNGRQPTIRCSKGEHYINECCVDDCNDHLCVPWGRYCMHHRDPKTRYAQTTKAPRRQRPLAMAIDTAICALFHSLSTNQLLEVILLRTQKLKELVRVNTIYLLSMFVIP